MTPQPANELLPPTTAGRVYAAALQPGLGDCAPSGRMRLDAIARWLQDIAFRDVEQAGLQDVAVWVLRRTRIRVQRFPQFAEHCEVRTYCSGVGRMWAERRTSIVPITGAATPQPVVEAVAVWVHLDPGTMRPTRLTPRELEVYGESAAGREVHARLRHPKPAADAESRDWSFRLTEADLADHVNNAAYWAVLEERMLARDAPAPGILDIELEHRAPAQPGLHRVLSDGDHQWVVGAEGGEVLASAALLSGGWGG